MVPKILNCRFALISALAVLGAVTFAPKASAVTVDVIFQGTIAPTCTFGTPTLPAANVLTATGDTFNTTTPGVVSLVCNSGASTLGIAAPTQTSGATLTAGATPASSSVTSPSVITTPITSGGGAVALSAAGGGITTGINENLSVTMTYQANAPIPVGTYRFTVTLTATPF